MEIRFCDRCSESIPDADFEAGRAIAVDGRSYHVNCALSRSLALTGPRAWLGFLLALYAAGVATYLLVRTLGEEEKPDVVSAVVEERITEAAGNARTTALDALEQQSRDFESALQSAVGEAEAHRTQLRTDLIALEARLMEADKESATRIGILQDRIVRLESDFKTLNEWVREATERARAALEEPPPPEETPSAPPPEPPVREPPDPPYTEPERDPEREAEVDRWIERLRDPNENIRFSATLELGRLKSLRATEPLLGVLKGDRDFYVRLGAATALGDIRACDAVPALIDRLNDDKDALVRTAANDALRLITEEQRAVTGDDFLFDADMSSTERKRIQKQWRDWWRANERAVRAQLGQQKEEG
ncbi:MAG: HEAT repeat domain-containing protein [Planctomycetota bacterium]|jgi:hypothetical protein